MIFSLCDISDHYYVLQDFNSIFFFTLREENCQVPRNQSATAVIEVFRKKIRPKYREAEFLVVCDTQKERKILINDLNNAQASARRFRTSSTY